MTMNTTKPWDGIAGASTPQECELRKKYVGYRYADPDYSHAGNAALEKLLDWKFGIRIHWGLYSVWGDSRESWNLTERNDPAYRALYENIPACWNPNGFDADQWMMLFRAAGFQFFTFTTKHHDGFSLFDTATRVKRRRVHVGEAAGSIVDCDLKYSIMETPFGRDVIKELVEAGRRAGLGIGLYFSHIDWFDSDFRIDQWNYQYDKNYTRQSDPAGYRRMIERHRGQLRELCTNYGKLDILSLDMAFPGFAPGFKLADGILHMEQGEACGIREDLVETVKMIRKLQPELLIRHRGIDPYGDYQTPERVVPSLDDPEDKSAAPLPWKVIYPGSSHFSYQYDDEYKPVSWIVRQLMDIAAKGGAFQLGYGPNGNGVWDSRCVDRMLGIGRWLKVNGEAVYSTRACACYHDGDQVRYTRSKDGKIVYAAVLDWKLDARELPLAHLELADEAQITILGLPDAIQWQRRGDAVVLRLPEHFQYRIPAKPDSFVFKITGGTVRKG